MKVLHLAKKHLPYLYVLVALVLLQGCKEEAGADKSIEEINTGGKISSIIRSPVTADGLTDTTAIAKMVFEETVHDFGEVGEGEIVKYAFKFTNTGQTPLLISDAHSTCGCTVPTWPKQPIPPGGNGVIEVEFNTKSKPNNQEKPVIITANTYPAVNKIYLKGFVRPV